MNENNVLYNGHVVCVKPFTKSKIPKVVVAYWKTVENVTMTIYGLLADYIAGDLNLTVWMGMPRITKLGQLDPFI